MDFIIILKGFALGWFLAYFEPLQDFINKHVKKYIPESLSYLKTAFSCIKCLSFWITLFITFDIFSASLAALIACTYERIINSFKINL